MKKLSPESLMMSQGYFPEGAENALKPPLYLSSTYKFSSAEEGKRFFQISQSSPTGGITEKMPWIYSRLSHPNIEIAEQRLCLWDEAEACALFESGMGAISTVLLEFLKPGDLILTTAPLYGGTDVFIHSFLEKIQVSHLEFTGESTEAELDELLEKSGKKEKLAVVYIETPANPTNAIIDIRKVCDWVGSLKQEVIIIADNTYMGPLWQKPLKHGVDIVLYSATKYIAGHSDLIAGAALGNSHLIQRIKALRTSLGNTASPHTSWLLTRSLETLKIRMDQQEKNAREIARFLENHPKVERVFYPEMMKKADRAMAEILENQTLGDGAMISFEITGGEKEAFTFLDGLMLIQLAVSLGSTESLAQHPYTMTHSAISEEYKVTRGITPKLIRLSVGIENPDDLIWDLRQALEKI